MNASNFQKPESRLNRVLISGSYKENPDNDFLCKILGTYLSNLNIGIVSGAGKAGINVSASFCERLDAEDKYDEEKIVFYIRRKEKTLKTEVDRIGSIKFFGNHPLHMRRKMISKVSAVIIIGGKAGTEQEEQLASIHHIPVIPIACSGGAAYDIWSRYKNEFNGLYGGQLFNTETFDALDSKNIQTAAAAAFNLLKELFDKLPHKSPAHPFRLVY